MAGSNAKQRQAAPKRRAKAAEIDVRALMGKKNVAAAKRKMALKGLPDRQPITDYVAAAAQFGADVKSPIPSSKVTRVLRRIAKDAVDLFGTQQAAMDYLEHAAFNQDGEKAAEVMAKKGVGPVLGRLEDLRYGPRG